jgi:hypothetical protein
MSEPGTVPAKTVTTMTASEILWTFSHPNAYAMAVAEEKVPDSKTVTPEAQQALRDPVFWEVYTTDPNYWALYRQWLGTVAFSVFVGLPLTALSVHFIMTSQNFWYARGSAEMPRMIFHLCMIVSCNLLTVQSPTIGPWVRLFKTISGGYVSIITLVFLMDFWSMLDVSVVGFVFGTFIVAAGTMCVVFALSSVVPVLPSLSLGFVAIYFVFQVIVRHQLGQYRPRR